MTRAVVRVEEGVPVLEDAIALAALAHRGQLYPTAALGRDPFILHPLRVMLRVSTEVERVTAVLHDVVEDTEYSLGDLSRLGYPSRVVDAVDRLSRREGERYEDYVDRILPDPTARAVKLADLEDNLLHNRGFDWIEEERARVARWERARARLLAASG